MLGISALDAMPSSEHDIIDPDDRSASAAAMETRLAATRVVETRRGANAEGTRGGVAVSPSALRKFSAATVWLRCEDRDGLLREISATITEIGGCSIVGYAGESLGDGEFVMTYTFVLDAKGELARALERCGAATTGEARRDEVGARVRRQARGAVPRAREERGGEGREALL